MAIASGACPSCGAEVTFRAGASMALVCAHCKCVVVRSDRGLENAGRVSDVVFSDTSLAPGDHGAFQGRSFEVHGRLVLQHPAGGTWEEYYTLFDGRYPGWIAEAQGRWYVMQEVGVAVPPPAQLAPGTAITLGPYGQFVVRERNQGTFLSAEGELPFAAQPGTPRVFVDLDAQNGACASVDFAADGTKVYVGAQTSYDQLAVAPRGGPRPEQRVGLQQIACPNCGGPMPMHPSAKSERVACIYCGALSDLATHRIIAQQDKNRAKPTIPLGRTGTFEGLTWTVIGYVERSTEIEGERFSWQEYLLYEPNAGYRWVVVDEGVWRFCAPVSAADVDTRGAPHVVRYNGSTYRVRNDGAARVDYVLGEFYWHVEVGETVRATDFESGNVVLSCEAAEAETNWTFGVPVVGRDLLRAFGVEAAAEAVSAADAADVIPMGSSGSGAGKIVWITLGVLVFFLFVIMAALGDEDGDASGVRGVSFGGMGGK